MNLDLDINNYDLDDILNLFKINSDFGENELKMIKKIVSQTHPDKSKLPPEYFMFYSKAYNILIDIYQFKCKDKLLNKSKITPDSYIQYEEKDMYMPEDKKQIIKKHLSQHKSNANFNEWFNEEFERNNIKREEDSGYGDWLKSNEGIEEKKIDLVDLGREIEMKKKQISQMIIYKGVTDTHSNHQGTYLTGDVPESFGSGLFSQLTYEDLRKAHTETVIPVTEEDYNNIPKFKNVNDYISFRSSQSTAPLSQLQANEYLNQKHKMDEQEASNNAYKLAKQTERSTKMLDNYWARISLLKEST